MRKKKLSEIKIYNRTTNNVENEVIFEKNIMDFFYGTKIGDFISRKILTLKFISYIYGLYQDSKLSKKNIKKFTDLYDFKIDEMDSPLESYESFNSFFTRKLKASARPIEISKDILISPADAKLLYFKIKKDTIIPIKGNIYTIYDLLENKEVAEKYINGICLVFRLAPLDYHRFCYIDSGSHEKVVDLKGKYYSVHPYALENKHPAFNKNHRQYTILNTENFGEVLYMEVGAMFVGTIIQNYPDGGGFNKGEEKGYFKFGGSTIVILIKENTVKIDEDIIKYSGEGIETIVTYGSKIGKK